MIAELRAAHLHAPGDFADGLRAWLCGSDAADAEAAGALLAETILLHRLWLKAHQRRE